MADIARKYLLVTDWAPRPGFGPIKPAWFCNFFVADVATEAGGATWVKIPERVGVRFERDPLAVEWARQNFNIRGWEIVFARHGDTKGMRADQILQLRQPGDVVSGTSDGGANPFHMGIVSDSRTGSGRVTISATGKGVEELPWSFSLPRVENFKSSSAYEQAALNEVRQFTVRRFIGT